MSAPHRPNQNHLLDLLPADELRRIASCMELAPMPLGRVYSESCGGLQHVYFPTTATISLSYTMEGGASAEIARVGKEGMLGISLFAQGKAAPTRACVQTAGFGYRMKAQLLVEEFNRAGTMRRLLLNYTRALMKQMAQTVYCNRHHAVDRRLCRWLSTVLDHEPSAESPLTQKLAADMLGVDQESILQALAQLQQAGLVSQHCGRIAVTDRFALEAHACECYRTIRQEFDWLSGMEHDWQPMRESAMAWLGTAQAAAQ